MIRLVVADDHGIVRKGLRQLIQETGDITVVGEAEDGQGVLEHVAGTPMDVLLLDMNMPGRSGVDLIQMVHRERPGLPVLVFSMLDEKKYAVRAIRAGARGFLSKTALPGTIADALRQVVAGRYFITAAVAEELAVEASGGEPAEPHRVLTDREFEILVLLAEGLRPTEIAHKLSLSIKTVSTHKTRVMAKLGARSLTDLIRYAIQQRLVEGGSVGRH